MKTHTGSSPRRSVGPASPSKRHETETPTRAFSHPPPSSLAKRKFDDSVNEPTPSSARTSNLKRPKQTPPSARSLRNSFEIDDQPEPGNGDITTNGYIDEETPLPGIEDQEVEEEAAAEPGAMEEEPSAILETQPEPQLTKRRGQSSVNTNMEDSQLSLSAAKPRGRPPKIRKEESSNEPATMNKAKSQNKKAKKPLKPVPASRGPNAKIQSRRNSTSKAPSRASSVAPGSRSHIVQRSETPAEDSAALITRSGRHSIKPLALWRGEHAVFDSGVIEENGLTLGGIREIIRTDEIIEPRPKKSAYRRKREQSAKLEDVEEEDEEMEDWERDTGIVTASVMGWDAVEGHFIEDLVDTQGSSISHLVAP